ncbi:hypothetical protein [Xylanimonas sp. McL0601]|uniref:hypothetical protein n=1 Tax=Xylanimonas sp. McL0601 TaxID=3414739 RepID=UPI003CE7AD8F
MTTEPVPGPETPAPDVVLVLTEATLTSADVEHLLDLYRDRDGDGVPDPLQFRVLVSTETERHGLASFIDHIGSGELREAWDELRGKPVEHKPAAPASEQLEQNIAALRAAGVESDGTVTHDDPLPALQAAVAAGDVREVVVVTYPHAVEDTLHSDWASRAREALSVPVLHLYAGTSELG